MRTKGKADEFLLRHYKAVVVFSIPMILLLSIFLPLSTSLARGGDFSMEIDPAIVNGILTATAIIFGFVAFELREIRSSAFERFLFSFPLLMFLMTTLEFVFIGAVFGKITLGTAFVATANCLFNILYASLIVAVKETRIEIEQLRKSERQGSVFS